MRAAISQHDIPEDLSAELPYPFRQFQAPDAHRGAGPQVASAVAADGAGRAAVLSALDAYVADGDRGPVLSQDDIDLVRLPELAG